MRLSDNITIAEEVQGIDDYKPKVLMICLCRFGGTLKCASAIASSLNKKTEIKMMVSSAADPEILPTDVDLISINTGKTRVSNIFNTINPINYLQIITTINKIKPDIIHFPVEHAWHIFLHGFLHDYPIVQTIHDPVRHSGEENPFYDLVRKVEILNSDRIIVLSERFKESFVKYGVVPGRVDVIPLGVFELSGNKMIPESLTLPSFNQNILFSGRILPYKGIDILIKSFKLLQEKFPKATLTIAGKGDLSDYMSLINSTDNIFIINRYVSEDELTQLHTSCDFVVAPYIDASQSAVVALALSNGRTVIATRVGGLPEQIVDGKTGILVDPNDIKQLTEAMELLLLDTNLNIRLAKQARVDYMTRFSLDVTAEKTLKTYFRAAEHKETKIRHNK